MSEKRVTTQGNATNLADILERVLDKGIVVAGDISVSIAEIELLSIRIRLVVCSVDKAKELGINWWKNDPFLSAEANDFSKLEEQNKALLQKIELLEQRIAEK
ncbi:MAG: gas vesicle protein [Bacteroidota bacterium]